MESTQCLGQLALLLDLVTRKKFAFIHIQFDSLLFQFMPIISCTPAMHHSLLAEPGSICFITSLQVLDICCDIAPKPAHLQAEQAQLSQILHPSTILMALH